MFLIGFPRSGTTLLDQIISLHSRIAVLEEKENLIDAYTRFPATEEGLRELENAGESELRKLRQKYRKRLEQEINSIESMPVFDW